MASVCCAVHFTNEEVMSIDDELLDITRKAFHEKGHRAEYYVPGIKFLGITIRKGYYGVVWFKCAAGQSCIDKMIASVYAPSPLLNYLLKNTREKKNV